MSDVPPLSPKDAEDIISKIESGTSEPIVIVGGQAIVFWATQYQNAISELRELSYTSRDIDLLGSARVALEIRDALRGRVRLNDNPNDHVRVNAAIVTFVDRSGHTREIDVLENLAGLKPEEVVKHCIAVTLPAGTEAHFMHPVHCMESRFHNTNGKLARRDSKSLFQLRTAFLCAKHYLGELYKNAPPQAVIDWNNRIYKFCRFNRNAAPVERTDPFEAIFIDGDDPKMQLFMKHQYPRMKASLEKRRK